MERCSIDIDLQDFSTDELWLNEYLIGSDKIWYTLPVAIEANCTNQIKSVKSLQ